MFWSVFLMALSLCEQRIIFSDGTTLRCAHELGHPVIRSYHQSGGVEWAYIRDPAGFGAPEKCTAGVVETLDEEGEGLTVNAVTSDGQSVPHVLPGKMTIRYFTRCQLSTFHAGEHESKNALRTPISIMNMNQQGVFVDRPLKWKATSQAEPSASK